MIIILIIMMIRNLFSGNSSPGLTFVSVHPWPRVVCVVVILVKKYKDDDDDEDEDDEDDDNDDDENDDDDICLGPVVWFSPR